jgi:hypothetical protein
MAGGKEMEITRRRPRTGRLVCKFRRGDDLDHRTSVIPSRPLSVQNRSPIAQTCIACRRRLYLRRTTCPTTPRGAKVDPGQDIFDDCVSCVEMICGLSNVAAVNRRDAQEERSLLYLTAVR